MSEQKCLHWQLKQPTGEVRGGVYLWILHDFENAPVYVGTAKMFSKRIKAHERVFRAGGYSFLRRLAIERMKTNSRTELISNWDRNRDAAIMHYPATPVSSDPVIRKESEEFWFTRISCLFAPMIGDVRDLKLVESTFQFALVDYYNELLNTKQEAVDHNRSKQFGKREFPNRSEIAHINLRHDFESAHDLSTGEFIEKLKEFSLK